MDSALFASGWVNQLPGILMKGISSGKVFESLVSVEPYFLEYKRLRKANELFIRSNHLSNYSSRIKFPNKDTIELFSEIRVALINLGYLDESVTESTSEALKDFQRYHGLNADGKPGANTIEALEKNTLYRYRVLALNLDRLRKNHYTDSSLVYINIPAYQLKIFESNSLIDTLRVIVGNPATPTPVLAGNMERIIANPLWYVPKSIAINEMLPKIKSDSGYLEKNGFMILDNNYNLVNARSIDFNSISENEFDYTFRQNRGTENSLGQVKFIFSNPYAVYLHDTPGKSLFEKDLRAFSHGCIRVEHPDKLADYILSEINADTTRLSNLIASGQQREFKLSSPLQVQITYITCEADENGKIYFYKDIYGNDKAELEGLKPFMGI
jgi:murein L,D-transpeptidase YcbB/YkuD